MTTSTSASMFTVVPLTGDRAFLSVPIIRQSNINSIEKMSNRISMYILIIGKY